MKQIFVRSWPQPSVAICTGCAALLLLVWAQAAVNFSSTVEAAALMVALCLTIAVALSYRYPVHVQTNTKVYMGTIPLFLIAALLPPLLAACAAGVGVLAGNLIIRSQRGLFLSDVVTDGGRWAAVALAGSIAARAPVGHHVPLAVQLIGVGVVLWLAEVLTTPLLLSPMSGLPPHRVIESTVRESGLAEMSQYLVGLLGALAATQGLWLLCLLLLPTGLFYVAFRTSKEMNDSTRFMVHGMADAVDLRDPYTGGHSRRVADYVTTILRQLPKHGPEADLIISAARVHDIGKIGIPDDVLRKDSGLTDDEWEIMKTHPAQGAELLSRYPDFARGADIIRHHHERWDGKGYPDGLKGTDIPLGARVIAVADSFDAMTSDRPYRAGMPAERARSILDEGRGRQWDSAVVDAFLQAFAPSTEPVVRPERAVSKPAASVL